MGNVYVAVCDDLKQQIIPFKMGPNLGSKSKEIQHPSHPFGAMLTHAMTSGLFWAGRQVRLIHDNDECDEEAYENYEDITDRLVAEYAEDCRVFYGIDKKSIVPNAHLPRHTSVVLDGNGRTER